MQLLIIALLWLTPFPTASDRTGPQDLQDASSHYRSAESHRQLATKSLQEAVDRSLPEKVTEARAELDRAAEEYIACAKSSASKVDETTRIRWAASGLLASYRADSALKLILQHPELQHEPEILRIKADALLVLGATKEAALAYELWIRDGKCVSAYRIWPGEPQKTGLLLLPKAVNDNCAILAPELRTRLETLFRLFGHPDNLPAKNYDTWPKDTK